MPVYEPPTRFNGHCMSRLVDTEAAAGREEYNKSATDNLLELSSPAQLLADLVGPEPLGSRAIELVAGVPCIDFSHKQTSICDHYRKRKKKRVRQKDQLWKSKDWGRTQKGKKKTHVFPTGISPVKLYRRA